MANLEVVFDLPEQLAAGLADGSLQRVGGVIVERDSKQIVAWLRDGSIDRVLDDGGVPRLIEGLVASKAGTSLANFTAGGLVLNLALTAISFHEIFQRLDRLSEAVSQLSEEMRAEFSKDRASDFWSALQAARVVFESENPQSRYLAKQSADDGLNKAKKYFLDEFCRLLSQPDQEETLIAAHHLLIRAMYAEVIRIRCFLAVEDIAPVEPYLGESIKQFSDYTKKLVRKFLGEKPAVYLHHLIETADVARFLRVQQWLITDNPLNVRDDASVLFQIIDELRKDFWKPEVTDRIEEENSFPSQIARASGQFVGELMGKLGQVRTDSKYIPGKAEKLILNLNHAEVLIENLDRLLGFEIELREYRLASESHSFQDWSRRISEQDIQEHGIGIIVDRERLERLSI